MCGVLAGGVATWNTALDGEFAFQTLLAPGIGLQLVDITNPDANLKLAEEILAGAQATPQGRARIALGAALSDTPGWFTPTSPEPAPTDFASQEANQFLWDQQIDFPFVFAFRAELELAPAAVSLGILALTIVASSRNPLIAMKSGRSIKPRVSASMRPRRSESRDTHQRKS